MRGAREKVEGKGVKLPGWLQNIQGKPQNVEGRPRKVDGRGVKLSDACKNVKCGLKMLRGCREKLRGGA